MPVGWQAVGEQAVTPFPPASLGMVGCSQDGGAGWWLCTMPNRISLLVCFSVIGSLSLFVVPSATDLWMRLGKFTQGE